MQNEDSRYALIRLVQDTLAVRPSFFLQNSGLTNRTTRCNNSLQALEAAIIVLRRLYLALGEQSLRNIKRWQQILQR